MREVSIYKTEPGTSSPRMHMFQLEVLVPVPTKSSRGGDSLLLTDSFQIEPCISVSQAGDPKPCPNTLRILAIHTCNSPIWPVRRALVRSPIGSFGGEGLRRGSACYRYFKVSDNVRCEFGTDEETKS